jgi:hypothetical protein
MNQVMSRRLAERLSETRQKRFVGRMGAGNLRAALLAEELPSKSSLSTAPVGLGRQAC